MAKLTGDQQVFLTLANARFERVKHICQEYKKRFGEEITPEQVSSYNLDTKLGQRDMGQDLKNLFKEMRDEYLADEKAIGGFHRIHRVRELEKLFDHPIVKASPRLAMDLWKQIAMEDGNMFRHRPAAITPDDVETYVERKMDLVRRIIQEVVTDEQQASTLLRAIKAGLGAEGGPGGTEGDQRPDERSTAP